MRLGTRDNNMDWLCKKECLKRHEWPRPSTQFSHHQMRGQGKICEKSLIHSLLFIEHVPGSVSGPGNREANKI